MLHTILYLIGFFIPPHSCMDVLMNIWVISSTFYKQCCNEQSYHLGGNSSSRICCTEYIHIILLEMLVLSQELYHFSPLATLTRVPESSLEPSQETMLSNLSFYQFLMSILRELEHSFFCLRTICFAFSCELSIFFTNFSTRLLFLNFRFIFEI